MVNKYLLAFLLTLVLLGIGIVVTKAIDDSRVDSIAQKLEEASLDGQATQQLLLYDSIFGGGNSVCPALLKRVDLQAVKIQGVLSSLERAKSENFLSNYDLLKRRYLNQNIELYLLVEKSIRDCDYSSANPVVFFYSDKVYCADCISQGKVLDSVRDECPGLRVFAFPHDLDLPVVEILTARYGISSVPAVVFNGQKTEGLASKEQLKQFFSCA